MSGQRQVEGATGQSLGTYNYNPLLDFAQAISTKYFIFVDYDNVLCKLYYVNLINKTLSGRRFSGRSDSAQVYSGTAPPPCAECSWVESSCGGTVLIGLIWNLELYFSITSDIGSRFCPLGGTSLDKTPQNSAWQSHYPAPAQAITKCIITFCIPSTLPYRQRWL